jgi:WD40 repeat protein
LWVWDIAGQRVRLKLNDNGGRISDADLTPDGRTLLVRRDPPAAGKASTLEVWDTERGTRTFAPAPFAMDTGEYRVPCGISADGRRAIVPDVEDRVFLWDVAGRATLPTLDMKRAAYINGAGFGAVSGRIAVAGSDLTLRQFDPLTGKSAGPVFTTKHIPVAVGWANGDRWLLSVTEAKRIVLVDSRTGDELAALPPFSFRAGGQLSEIEGRKFRVWLSSDGTAAVAHLPGSDFVVSQKLPQFRGELADLTALAELLTGLRADSGGNLDSLDPDTVRSHADRYLAAWRAWRSGSVADSK